MDRIVYFLPAHVFHAALVLSVVFVVLRAPNSRGREREKPDGERKKEIARSKERGCLVVGCIRCMEGESQGGITRQGHAGGGGGGGGQGRRGEPKRHDEGCCDPPR